MNNKDIFLLGVGRNTPVFIDIAEQSGYTVKGLYHYNNSRTNQYDHGYKIIGSFEDLLGKEDLNKTLFMLTMGDNSIRLDMAEKIRKSNGIVPAIIHPKSIISKFAIIDEGVIISPFTYIQANSHIGQDTIILSHVNISHGNTIGKGCFIAGGAIIGAYTNIGNMAFIGQGALTISEKVSEIGNSAFIGAGALVTKSVKENEIVAGFPAMPISKSKSL